MSKKQLNTYPSLAGTISVGWERDDVSMVHVFAATEAGAVFKPSDGHGGPHWPCPVCKAHDYTQEDFDQQMRSMMAASKPVDVLSKIAEQMLDDGYTKKDAAAFAAGVLLQDALKKR